MVATSREPCNWESESLKEKRHLVGKSACRVAPSDQVCNAAEIPSPLPNLEARTNRFALARPEIDLQIIEGERKSLLLGDSDQLAYLQSGSIEYANSIAHKLSPATPDCFGL
jgi:hypothetical protein